MGSWELHAGPMSEGPAPGAAEQAGGAALVAWGAGFGRAGRMKAAAARQTRI